MYPNMLSTYTDKEKNLINNIHNIDLLDLVKNNFLSFEFILNYVLNENYQKSRKDKNITIQTVINHQPHLRDKFMYLLKNQENEENEEKQEKQEKQEN
jgi:hypothetical protein